MRKKTEDNSGIEHIGDAIRKAREQKKMSQKELAAAIEIDPTQYNRIELGKSVPGLKTVAKIAHTLDTTVDELLNGEGQTEEVEIKDKSLFDKVRMIDGLPDDEKNIILKVIDLALSKKKFKDFFQQQLQP
jgi:transcriptional regulator with XRE-family HTH domain